MDSDLRHKVLTGVIWQYVQRLGSQAVQFVVSIVLTRLLLPDDFGTIAMLGVFIALSNIFIDSGFGNALIQKKDVDEIDCSSVFYLNIASAFIIYFVIFIGAPLISDFYSMPELTMLLRVLSVQIIFMGFSCVQASLLVRQLKFQYNFYIAIIGNLVSAMVGIGLAYNGYGVWSIVYSQLFSQICYCLGLWIFVGWRPKLIFSFVRLRGLFRYSSKILGGTVISVLYNNIYNIIIGKRFSAIDLGYYNRGQLLPNTAIDTASNSINSVLFPALSRFQNDTLRHKEIIRRAEQIISFIIFIIASLMFVLAPDIIKFLYGEKWLTSVAFMQIVCITLSISPISVLNQSIQTSLGRSDIYLKTMFLSKIVAIIVIFCGALIGLYAMIIAGSIASLITFLITRFYNKKLINYSFKEQLSDIGPSILLSTAAGLITYFVTLLHLGSLLTIIVGGMIGIISYLILSHLFKVKSMTYILTRLRSKRN